MILSSFQPRDTGRQSRRAMGIPIAFRRISIHGYTWADFLMKKQIESRPTQAYNHYMQIAGHNIIPKPENPFKADFGQFPTCPSLPPSLPPSRSRSRSLSLSLSPSSISDINNWMWRMRHLQHWITISSNTPNYGSLMACRCFIVGLSKP